MYAVVPSESESATTERKTGLKVTNVETVGLVRDGGGWLRLATEERAAGPQGIGPHGS